jgi:hypothetical protein
VSSNHRDLIPAKVAKQMSLECEVTEDISEDPLFWDAH